MPDRFCEAGLSGLFKSLAMNLRSLQKRLEKCSRLMKKAGSHFDHIIFAMNQGVDPGYCVVPTDPAGPSDAKESKT